VNSREAVDDAHAAVDAPGDDAPVDGRAARAAKTRNAIADALLDLLADGQMRPTAKEIADRAGVSVRSVYVHFDDLEGLYCVAAARYFGRVAPMLAPVAAVGTVEERADALVRQRVRLYLQTGAIGRATRLHAESSPTLERIVRDGRNRSRAELERVFAHELESLDEPERDRVVAMLDVLCGPETWETLHLHHDLDVDVATRCIADAIVVHLREAGS
jgi:TetR/AcrR family transcriptional regulator, regulator of autoinduction and epiphytic fitness